MAMDTSPETIFATLKKIAPLISFSVDHQVDPHFVWDGDGPDPKEDGFEPYDATVTAESIVEGESVEGLAFLGGVYDRPWEIDRDIHGYLPQMLQEAAEELEMELRGSKLHLEQVRAAQKYLKEILHARYEEQQEESYERRFRKKRWGQEE